MTDLTEQWKNGELPEGYYYIKVKDEIANYPLLADCVEGLNYTYFLDYEDYVQTVLAPAPSYSELQVMNEAVNQTMAANIKLVERVKQLEEQIKHLSKTQARQFVDNQKLQVKAEKAKDVVNIDTARQIKQLKDLLKECKPYIALHTEHNKHVGFTPDSANLLTKIKEVLDA